jgi:hypothetical protein
MFLSTSGFTAPGSTFAPLFLRASADKAYPMMTIPPNNPPANAIGTMIDDLDEYPV